MVLSPQCFHNLNLHSDIFNHSNVHFWEYMQPGYDALGFISCTGGCVYSCCNDCPICAAKALFQGALEGAAQRPTEQQRFKAVALGL